MLAQSTKAYRVGGPVRVGALQRLCSSGLFSNEWVGGLIKHDLLLVFLKLLIMNSSSRSYRDACGFPWLHLNTET